jgi:hypothetical protein
MHKRMVLPLLLAFATGCTSGSSSESTRVADGALLAGIAAPSTALASASDQVAHSMCAGQEAVLFACKTTKGKLVSICASRNVSADQGNLYYAYGSPAGPELVFPGHRRPPGDFKRTQLTFAGSTGGYAYSFATGGYRYIVYSVSGAQGLEEQGVMITRGDARKAVAALPCTKGTVVEDDDPALLDITLAWPADADLEQHGLPRRD